MIHVHTVVYLKIKSLFSLLNTGIYQHSTLIVPKKEKLCIKDGGGGECQVFEICKTSSNDIKKIHDLCIDQGK